MVAELASALPVSLILPVEHVAPTGTLSMVLHVLNSFQSGSSAKIGLGFCAKRCAVHKGRIIIFVRPSEPP